MKNQNKILGAILFIGLTIVSCQQPVLVDKFIEIPDRSWDYTHQPEIDVNVQNRNTAYRVYVNFRHNNQYEYSNVFLLIHQKAGETQRVELTLAEPDGRWTGKQSGDIYTHQELIMDQFRFPDTGRFVFSMEQNMRENPLKGAVAAGLRIEEVK